MTMSLVVEHFDDLLATPEDVEQLNRTILQLAVRGKLTRQETGDESAGELLKKIKKEKPLPLIEESEKPFDLPDGWEWVRLENIVSVLGDGLHGTPEYADDGEYFFINGNNLSNGKIEIKKNTKRVTQSEYDKYKKELNLNTVFVSINGTIGNLAFYNNEKIILGKSACYFNLLDGIDKFYIGILIRSPYFLDYARVVASRTTISNISLKSMRHLMIPLPPLAEQQRIVARVEELFVQTRALAKELDHSQIELDGLNKSALSHLLASETPEEFNQHWDFIAEHFDLLFQTPEHVAPLRQSILELAVRGKLTRRKVGDESAGELLKRIKDEKAKFIEEGIIKEGKLLSQIKYDEKPFELPKEWEWVKFDHVAANRPNALKAGPFGSSLKKSVYVETGYKIYGQEQVIKGDAEYGDYYIDEELFEQLRSNEVFPGDILISLVGTIGKVLVLPEGSKPGIINPRLVKLSLFKEVNRSYFKYYLYSPTAKNLMSESSHGGTMNILNLGLLRELPVPLPPLAEQERIVKRVEELLSLCDALEARLQSAEEERGRLVAAVMSTVGG